MALQHFQVGLLSDHGIPWDGEIGPGQQGVGTYLQASEAMEGTALLCGVDLCCGGRCVDDCLLRPFQTSECFDVGISVRACRCPAFCHSLPQ